jgi:hypothetical protein
LEAIAIETIEVTNTPLRIAEYVYRVPLLYYYILDKFLSKNISSHCESLKDWRPLPLRPLRPPPLLLQMLLRTFEAI